MVGEPDLDLLAVEHSWAGDLPGPRRCSAWKNARVQRELLRERAAAREAAKARGKQVGRKQAPTTVLAATARAIRGAFSWLIDQLGCDATTAWKSVSAEPEFWPDRAARA